MASSILSRGPARLALSGAMFAAGGSAYGVKLMKIHRYGERFGGGGTRDGAASVDGGFAEEGVGCPSDCLGAPPGMLMVAGGRGVGTCDGAGAGSALAPGRSAQAVDGRLGGGVPAMGLRPGCRRICGARWAGGGGTPRVVPGCSAQDVDGCWGGWGYLRMR